MKATEITDLMAQAITELTQAESEKVLEGVRIKYLGRKGLLPEIMKGLKSAASDEKPKIGQAANLFKEKVKETLNAQKAAFEANTSSTTSTFDYTLPGHWRGIGNAHPISNIMNRVIDIFRGLGFTVADGPDIETVFNNFDALNTPADHPSRDDQDTFYLEDGSLLRTHTSPVQIRYMKDRQPPIRIIAPGRCYRRDTPDATHSANFHQIEGLYVDDAVSMSDLKSDLTYFFQQLVGDDVKIRFRPHFFPFTEPSVEVDFSSPTCKNGEWIEIAGAGMVDPEVFKAVGYDPDAVTGYAFGMGVERIAMILYGIQDIRHLYENDVRYLKQF